MGTADPAARREYLLAEIRCALIRTKLAQLDIEAVGVALKYGAVSAEQALDLFWDSNALRFIGAPGEAQP